MVYRYTLYFATITALLCNTTMWIVAPEYTNFNLFLFIITLLLLSGIFYLHRRELNLYARSSHFKHLRQTMLTTLLLFLFLATLNYLGFRLAKQFYLGEGGDFKLSSQTLNLLKENDQSLSLTIFIRRNDEPSVRYLLELYRIHSDGKLSYHFIDPDLAPVKAKEYGINEYGEMILEGSTTPRKIKIQGVSEQKITQGILKSKKVNTTIVYHIVGHEERLSRTEEFSLLTKAIEEELISLHPLELSKISSIPQETGAVVIWGPKSPYLREEIEKLRSYLNQGGRILIALDPEVKGWKHHDLARLFEEWGISYSNNLAIDLLSHVEGSKGTVPLTRTYSELHPITYKFTGQTFFPLSSSFKIDARPNIIKRVEVTPLIFTSEAPHSFAETNTQQILSLTPSFDPLEDEGGPLNLVMASTLREGKGRVVAFGCSSFVTNPYANFRANFNLFLNALSWLADDEYTWSADRASFKEEPIFMGSSHLGVIFYFSLVVAPLTLLLLSFYFYRRRKKL